jgi:DNA-binding transcriptional MocR family regulator
MPNDRVRYELLTKELAKLIEQGVLRPGDRLPSLRAASEQHRLSIGTVHRAYEVLEERGLVEVRPQSGFYVRARLPRAATRERTDAPEPTPSTPPLSSTFVDVDHLVAEVIEANRRRDVVPLGLPHPNPNLLPLDQLNRMAASEARRLSAWASIDDVPLGNAELRRLIALRYLKSNIAVSPEDIVVTCGAMEAMNLSLAAVTKPGDVIAIESPSYYRLLSVAELMGLKVAEVATHPREGIDLKSLRGALRSLKISACVVMGNFQKPLGATMLEGKKRELASLLAREGVPLIEDDVFAELYFEKERPRPVKAFDRKGMILHCGSFSKCVAPGYRVGWVAPGRFQYDVQRLKVRTSIATASLPQAAIAEYVKHGGYERHLRRLRRALSEGMQALSLAVRAHFPPGTRLSRPRGGYMLWVEVPEPFDAMQLHKLALAKNISLLPGPLFSPRRGYRNCVGLNFGQSDVTRAREAVATLGGLCAKATTRS